MRIEKLNSREGSPACRKLRVAAYVRVSVDTEPSIHSLDNQKEAYIGQIESNPKWELAGIYEDRGISGTKEMRPEFQRMLSDCRNGKIDIILTKSFTRFARNTVVLLQTLRELKELNIEVVFEKDNIRSLSESGELLITLLAAFAQAESQSASENQLWRIRKAFEEGRAVQGLMLGYRLKDGKLVVVPEEAETVRQIFEDYLSGMGLRAIAKKLNKQKIFTIRHKPWHLSSIRNVLENEKYTGNMFLQKTYTRDYISKKHSINNGERTKYFVENSHEAIIPQDMFDEVQAERKRRAEKCKVKHLEFCLEHYPFTGMIVCGKCGKKFWRHIQTINGGEYYRASWTCSTYTDYGKGACDNGAVPEEILLAKTAELLGTEDLDTAVPELLESILIPNKGSMIYIFKNGEERELEWETRSHKTYWTDELRKAASERMIKRRREEKRNV